MKTPARKSAAKKKPAAAKKPVAAERPATAKAPAATISAAAKQPARLDQSALQSLAGYSLRRAEVLMRQHFTRTLADWDIRGAEYSVLVLTASNSEVTQADLGEALNIKRPNMVSLIERLEKRGLIVRRVHQRDRRNHILSLTEKGEALLTDIEDPVRQMDRRVTACWTARERAQVVALLQRFYRNGGA